MVPSQKTISANVFKTPEAHEGKFSITIRRNGQDFLKINDKDKIMAVGGLALGGVTIMFAGHLRDNVIMIGLRIKDSASGDYKFANEATKKK